jgi:hypothetical protein
MDFDFLKDRYDYELQRKEQLNAALTLPVAALSLLGGAMVAMARSFTYAEAWLSRAFQTALGLDAAAFVSCLIFLAFAYHRQRYRYLEHLATLEAWKDDYAATLRSQGFATDTLNMTIKEHLRGRIIDAADRNTDNNDARSGMLYWARIALFVVLFLTAAAGVPYVIDQARF